MRIELTTAVILFVAHTSAMGTPIPAMDTPQNSDQPAGALADITEAAAASSGGLLGDTVILTSGPQSAVVSNDSVEFTFVSDPAFGGAFVRSFDFFDDRMVFEWLITKEITTTSIFGQRWPEFASVDWPGNGLTDLIVDPGNMHRFEVELLSPSSFVVNRPAISPGADGVYLAGERFVGTVYFVPEPATSAMLGIGMLAACRRRRTASLMA